MSLGLTYSNLNKKNTGGVLFTTSKKNQRYDN